MTWIHKENVCGARRTLFRVTIMRNEFNADYNNPMDETMEVVISDIAQRAVAEKEQRKTASLKEETSDI
ncbi:unnamed protein product [Caenorhabditis sp. 36 PRJEB53466]|nr:unnamed protein product [Caenorhabditis sp. 36 PRJEB53466]